MKVNVSDKLKLIFIVLVYYYDIIIFDFYNI